MNNIPFTASIRSGVNSDIDTINVRKGPGTDFAVLTELPTGTDNLVVKNVSPDSKNSRFGNKVYQWFEIVLPDGSTGWIRDDLIDVSGDGTPFGYGVIMGKAFALELSRAEPDQQRSNRPTPLPAPSPSTAITSLIQDRVVKVAFTITSAFEGSGYASYQTYDRGLISYGRFQFTLASSSLASVIERYIQLAADDRIANTLERIYLQRVKERDPSLREDRRFKMLLQHAATTPEMQAAQDEVAFTKYWQVVEELSLVPRSIQFPLTKAMAFDIGIQHGPRHDLFATAERQMGLTPRSRVTNEREFAKRVAQIRRQILYRIAEQQGLGGVRHRADFWISLIQNGDWELMGDNDGNVEIFGRKVQIRNL